MLPLRAVASRSAALMRSASPPRHTLQSVEGRPILVTGSHRSGTTWVGAALALSPEVVSVHEPFNPTYERSWLAPPPERWFQYIDSSTAARWVAPMTRVVELRPPLLRMLRRSWRPKHAVRIAQEGWSARLGHYRGHRAILKDPIAFFSAEWIHSTFAADVIVLVRHPAAFASSLKRLNWTFDFSNLTEQSDLMETLPNDHADRLRTAAVVDLDIIDTSILLWNVINATALRYRDRHPTWVVSRYEDLAADPIAAFESVYRGVGLQWTAEIADAVSETNRAGNARDVPDGDKGGVIRDSRAAMWTWLNRLSNDEVSRVRAGTAEVADAFYASEDWKAPSM